MKRHIHKTILKTTISVIILIILSVAGGIAYVYFTNQSNTDNSPKAVDTTTESSKELKPTPPRPDAVEQAAIESLISPVKAGENSSITVKTNAGSKCTISIKYKDVASTDSGLIPKTADAWGNVSWSWTVDASAPVGTWPVKVMCYYHTRSAMVIGDLKVAK